MHGVKAELNLAEENKEGPVEKPSRNPTGPRRPRRLEFAIRAEVKAELIRAFGLGQLGRSKITLVIAQSTVRYTSLAANRFNGRWSD
jgi:hypothetical protein